MSGVKDVKRSAVTYAILLYLLYKIKNKNKNVSTCIVQTHVPPEYFLFRCVCVCVVLIIEPRTMCMLGKCFTMEPHSPVPFLNIFDPCHIETTDVKPADMEGQLYYI